MTQTVRVTSHHIHTDPSLTLSNLTLALESLPDTQWKAFGEMIEMPESTLKELESQFNTDKERKMELLSIYVTHPEPTWEHVSDALYRMRDAECYRTLDVLQSNFPIGECHPPSFILHNMHILFFSSTHLSVTQLMVKLNSHLNQH